MVELKHVGVFSAAKVMMLFLFICMILYCVLIAVTSLVVSGSLMLLMLVGSSIATVFLMVLKVDPAGLGDALPFAGFLLLFINSLITGFIWGAVTALIYNVIASVLGGIDVTFTKKEAPGAMPMQTTAATAGTMGAASATGVVKSSGVTTAVNPELLNYVKGELAAKRGKEEVVSELVKAGWSQNDIQAALDAAVLG